MQGDRDKPGAQSLGPRALSDPNLGRIFGGKYRIEQLIAQGGMGRVYRAAQLPLERTVAVKILSRDFQRSNPQFAPRFFLEAASAAKLAHPHSITVFDYGESETGELYIAMEFLKGRTLSDVVTEEGPFSPTRALKIAIQICRALREAHQLGIIHRDLKPGNIFLLDESDEGDYAKVLDFGLVKLVRPSGEAAGNLLGSPDAELTHTGSLLGSPKYMSPEQILGHDLDARTDVYSLGVLLFQMLTGKAPFNGVTGVEVVYKHVHEPPPRLSEIAQRTMPASLERLVARALSKKREDRQTSMDELLGELKAALRELVNDPRAATSDIFERRRGTTDSAVANAFSEEPTPLPQISDEHPSPSQLAAARKVRGWVLALALACFVVTLGLLASAVVTWSNLPVPEDERATLPAPAADPVMGAGTDPASDPGTRGAVGATEPLEADPSAPGATEPEAMEDAPVPKLKPKRGYRQNPY